MHFGQLLSVLLSALTAAAMLLAIVGVTADGMNSASDIASHRLLPLEERRAYLKGRDWFSRPTKALIILTLPLAIADGRLLQPPDRALMPQLLVLFASLVAAFAAHHHVSVARHLLRPEKPDPGHEPETEEEPYYVWPPPPLDPGPRS